MKTFSSLCAVAALAFSAPSFAQHAGGAMSSPGAHTGGHSAAGGFGHFGTRFQQPNWFSGGWPDRPQTFSPTGFRDRRGFGHRNSDRGLHGSNDWTNAYPSYWGYGSWNDNDGYVFAEPSADMFGFYGAGGDVDLMNGSAVYQYDRSYPYDWYRGGPAETVRVHRAAEARCETKLVPDGKGKGSASVRICRR